MKKQMFKYSLVICLNFLLSSYSFAENSEKPPACTIQKGNFECIDVKINKSPTDNAIYQAIKLSNEMEVLLISDPKANKSLFSVGLPIGSMEDPKSQQGLAHYLEHMILMGSKSYPETNSLDGFLSKNGGMNNAYTAPDRTIYYFQVNNNAIDEAVARLSDAFVAPLLSEGNAKKEINAVNAEMVRAKSSDGHMLLSVNRNTANPEHPANNFSVGNKESLSDKGNSLLQDELVGFYQKYYSSNLMKAVIYSNKSISELAELAALNLGKMANKKVPMPKIDKPLFREEDKGVFIQYQPVSPTKMLVVSFDLPEDKSDFRQKSGEFIAYLLSNNSDKTLSDYLIKSGLSDSGVNATYSDDVSRNRADLSIYIHLTDKGLAEQDKIISLIFQYIEKIKQEGVNQAYFYELKESAKQDFEHLRVDKSFDYAAELVSQMISYPLEHIIDQPYAVENMDTKAIQEKLDMMKLDDVRIILIDQNIKADKRTAYFEAPYTIAKFSDVQKQRWENFSLNPKLELPQLNPYFTTDFSLNTVNKERIIPNAIVSEKGKVIYAMSSRYFGDEPKANLAIVFSRDKKLDDLKSQISADLLFIMHSLSQSKIAFQASVAGLSTEITGSANGLTISANGYTQKLPKLLEDMLLDFSRFALTENMLEQAKQRYIESLNTTEKQNAQRQASSAIANFANYPYFDISAKRKAVSMISLQDIQQLRERLLSDSDGMKFFSLGNFSDQQVKDIIKSVETIVKNKNQQLEFGRYVNIHQSQRKLNYIQSIPHEDNALSIGYFPNKYDEMEGRVRASLLSSILANWYFDDLRSDKQLGYVVSVKADRIGVISGLTFIVQSPTASPKTIMEHNQRFFKESLVHLNKMSAAEFENYRSNMVDILEHKPETLGQEFSDYSADFLRGNSRFDRKAMQISLLKQLEKQDIIDFYQQAVIEQQGLVFASQAIGTKTEIAQPAELNGFEKVESIEMLQREFEIKNY